LPSTNRPGRNGSIPLIPDRDDPPSGGRAIPALLFVLAAVGLFARALTGFFLSDDWVLLHGVDRGGPLGVWSGRGSMFFRPLISLSRFADHRLFGLNRLGFHLTNAVLHGLCSWQVFEIAGRLLRGLEAPATSLRTPARRAPSCWNGWEPASTSGPTGSGSRPSTATTASSITPEAVSGRHRAPGARRPYLRLEVASMKASVKDS